MALALASSDVRNTSRGPRARLREDDLAVLRPPAQGVAGLPVRMAMVRCSNHSHLDALLRLAPDLIKQVCPPPGYLLEVVEALK
jgi:hypothetical protein